MTAASENCACPLSDQGASIVNSSICSGTLLFMVLLEGYIRGRCKITEPCKRVKSVDKLNTEYDFIVVGAGSAGSIIAGRLSDNSKNRVLLLEAGGQEPVGARVPSFYRTFWSHEEVDWRYRTVPSDYCYDQNGLGCKWPRGKVLGGSSVLNGMMYHRGHPADYEDWVNAGAKGWSWEENLKYFCMTEGNKQIGTAVNGKYHSASGPLPVQHFKYQPPFVHDLLDAINDTGLPLIADMNNPKTPDGFCIAQTMSDDGQRYTTARAFLKPQTERPNLSVKLNARVTKVLIQEKNYRRKVAYGVEFIDKHGNRKVVTARKEVIISAGALNTPQILMLSGIGPRQTLQKLDIPIVADLPVGLNLKNHYGMTFNYKLTKLNDTRLLDWSVLAEYLLIGDGPMSSTGITQVTGIMYSSLADRRRNQPDLQFFFNGLYAECSSRGEIGESAGNKNGTNISVNAVVLLPRSVGYVTLNSTNPFASPLFYPGYFSHPDDMVMIKDAAKYVKRILNSDLLMNKYGARLDPAYTNRCDRVSPQWSDSWIECMARVYTDPQNHQLGTAAIGQVVDPQLKVYNIERLRVADASVMPTQPTGNPQGAIMMVAERAADFILKTWQ